MKAKLIVFCLLFCALILSAQETKVLPKLIIGGDYNYPPYEFINEKGQPDGYNVELSRAICKELGFEPEFRLAKWSLVRSWLEDGSIDVVQGMAYSLERAKELKFSIAHTTTWRSIFVQTKSSIINLQHAKDITLVVQKDDVSVDYLRQIGFAGKSTEVSTQEEALKLLNDGVFEASVANYMMGMYIIEKENLSNIKALPQRIYQRDYCYASRNPELIIKIDEALVKIGESGALLRMQDAWFASLNFGTWTAQQQSKIAWVLALLLGFGLLLALSLLILYIRRLRAARNLLEQQVQRGIELEHELDSSHASFVQGPVILYKLDYENKKLMYVSENVQQWGYSVPEMLKAEDNYIKLVYSEDIPRLTEYFANVQMNTPNRIQYRVLTKSGEIRWVLDYNRAFKDERNGRLYLYGYEMDVTDQKNLEAQLLDAKEKAEAANIAKSHFLANMSHEIRTPLNGVNGFLQVLMQMQATDEQREIFDLMYSSGKNLMKIINDILDFSKIEAGKMELILSEFNPKYLVGDMVKQYSLQSRKQDLEFRINISNNLPDVLKGDQLRLKQILMNLMQNAMKFTERGSIEIGAELYTISEKDVRILFKVADTGIGIDPVKQNDIFDNYTQASSIISLKYGGTGLGLAIVKKLVEMMQGFIWVESELGKGSCFFFILPFALHTEAEAKNPLERIPRSIAVAKLRGRVLLVEDEPINQLVTKRQLELWGLQVDLAENGEEACAMHQSSGYDLILMDIQLPVMDGLTATLRIRELEQSKASSTPIIAYTAAALMGDRERFLAKGMDDYLAKPIDMNELYNILAKHLHKLNSNGT